LPVGASLGLGFVLALKVSCTTPMLQLIE
jgi:hypothetical protein